MSQPPQQPCSPQGTACARTCLCAQLQQVLEVRAVRRVREAAILRACMHACMLAEQSKLACVLDVQIGICAHGHAWTPTTAPSSKVLPCQRMGKQAPAGS